MDWRNVNPACDDVCGGAGCDKCGDGRSCDGSDYGAVSKANKAMAYARDVEKKLLEDKDASGKSVLVAVREVQEAANNAHVNSQMAFDEAERARNISETNKVALQDVIDKIFEFLARDKASPESVRTVSQNNNTQ